MNLQQRVITEYGPGEIVKIEGPYGPVSKQWFRYGVKFDKWPSELVIDGDVAFFSRGELVGEGCE